MLILYVHLACCQLSLALNAKSGLWTTYCFMRCRHHTLHPHRYHLSLTTPVEGLDLSCHMILTRHLPSFLCCLFHTLPRCYRPTANVNIGAPICFIWGQHHSHHHKRGSDPFHLMPTSHPPSVSFYRPSLAANVIGGADLLHTTPNVTSRLPYRKPTNASREAQTWSVCTCQPQHHIWVLPRWTTSCNKGPNLSSFNSCHIFTHRNYCLLFCPCYAMPMYFHVLSAIRHSSFFTLSLLPLHPSYALWHGNKWVTILETEWYDALAHWSSSAIYLQQLTMSFDTKTAKKVRTAFPFIIASTNSPHTDHRESDTLFASHLLLGEHDILPHAPFPPLSGTRYADIFYSVQTHEDYIWHSSIFSSCLIALAPTSS